MEVWEKTFKCAGACYDSPIYLFSNVNNGLPESACGTKVANYLTKYSKRIGIISFIIFGFLFITVLMSCCLCCHPEKKEESIYNRMV